MTTPRFSRSALAAGAAALGALGAIGVAQFAGGASPVVNFTPAQSSSEATTSTTAAAANADAAARPARPRPAPLDAETDAKVKAAAEKAVEGSTYQHGHKNRDGSGYKALVTKADGTRVLVHLNNEFAVTKIDDPAPARGRGPGHHGVPLDAATEAKVKDAALAAVPGSTFNGARQEPDGDGYNALVTKADGTKVLVHEDVNFKVTRIDDPAPMRGPRHGAPLDAATEAKVKDAALAAVPGSTFNGARQEFDGDGYNALVTKADGTKVLVHEDANFKVTRIDDPAPQRGPGGPGGGRGHGGPRGGAAPADASGDSSA